MLGRVESYWKSYLGAISSRPKKGMNLTVDELGRRVIICPYPNCGKVSASGLWLSEHMHRIHGTHENSNYVRKVI